MNPQLILVEDDNLDAIAVQRGLIKQGVRVDCHRAENGEQALSVLNELAKQVPTRQITVLLDINMPRINGLEFLQMVRSDPNLDATTVYILSSSELPKDIEAAEHLGVERYLTKAELNTALQVVKAHLEEVFAAA